MTRRGRILLLHAFDALNMGDRLLVEESVDLTRRAGVAADRLTLVAVNAASFSALTHCVQYPSVRRAQGLHRIASAVSTVQMTTAGIVDPAIGRYSVLGRLVREASLVLGVGGGYLRAPGGVPSLNAAASHLPQLALAGSVDVTSLYLPQSLGPLRGRIGQAIRHRLSAVSWYAMRDDHSEAELPDPPPPHDRVPDLAALRLGRTLATGLEHTRGRRYVLIARGLPFPTYHGRLEVLRRCLPVEWAVHSRALGQDDSLYYRKIGVDVAGESIDLFESGTTGVVISVRLHGALQAILAGIPAIHLSYEHKGAGAYADLGLTEWLHHAGTFDPEVVAQQARELVRDPGVYWDRLGSRAQELAAADTALVDRVRRAYEGT